MTLKVGDRMGDFTPCPTCHQYSHSIGDDALTPAFNHFQAMVMGSPLKSYPTGYAFTEETRHAAQVLMAAAPVWRSMDSAPRDGRQIILDLGQTIPDGRYIRSASYIDGNGCVELGHDEFEVSGGWMMWDSDGASWEIVDIDQPTAWQPLPAPPQTGE